VENEKSCHPFMPSAANLHDDAIFESADAGRSMSTGTSSQSGSQTADNVQPRSSDAANPLSPVLSIVLEVTPPGPSAAATGSYHQVSSDDGWNSRHRSPSAEVPTREKHGTAPRHGEEGVPVIPQHPASAKALPSPANEYSVVDDTLLKCLVIKKATEPRAEELGGIIRTACDNLAKSCIACWMSGLEYHSHPLDECRWGRIEFRSEMWRKWIKTLRLPVGCCFFCGCPRKVRSGCVRLWSGVLTYA
jgi:hypothetical protein